MVHRLAFQHALPRLSDLGIKVHHSHHKALDQTALHVGIHPLLLRHARHHKSS